MTIEADIFTALQAHAPLTALIGTAAACRAWPDEAPESQAYPLIVFTRIAGVPTQALDGSTGNLNGRFQFSCWGETFDSADAVAEALKNAIEAASTFQHIWLNTFSGPVEPELKLFHRIVEFSTWSTF